MRNISAILRKVKQKKTSGKTNVNVYAPSGLLRTIYNTQEDFDKTETLFLTAKKALAEVVFDEKIFTTKLLLTAAFAFHNTEPEFDEKTCNIMRKIVAESAIREGGKNFFERFGT